MRPPRCSRSLRSTNSVTGSPTASEAPTRTPKSWNVQVSKKKDSESVKSQSAQKRPASLQSFGKAVSDVCCPGVHCAVSCKEIGAFGHKMLPLGGKWLLVQFSELFNFSSNLKLARLLSYGILRFVEHKFTQQRENTLKIKICFHVQLAVANGFSAKILMRPESRFGKCPASFPGWESFAVLLYQKKTIIPSDRNERCSLF